MYCYVSSVNVHYTSCMRLNQYNEPKYKQQLKNQKQKKIKKESHFGLKTYFSIMKCVHIYFLTVFCCFYYSLCVLFRSLSFLDWHCQFYFHLEFFSICTFDSFLLSQILKHKFTISVPSKHDP